MTGEVSRPLSAHVPVHKICQRLQRRDGQICELRYGRPCSRLRVLTLQQRVWNICRLKGLNGHSCSSDTEHPVLDWSRDALSKMRVLELRRVLASWGEECRACLEKSELSISSRRWPPTQHSAAQNALGRVLRPPCAAPCWGDRALVRGPPHAASSWGHTAVMGGLHSGTLLILLWDY